MVPSKNVPNNKNYFPVSLSRLQDDFLVVGGGATLLSDVASRSVLNYWVSLFFKETPQDNLTLEPDLLCSLFAGLLEAKSLLNIMKQEGKSCSRVEL